MIAGYTFALISACCLAALLAFGLGLAGRAPGDVSVGSLAVVELGLIGQVVIALIAPLAGNPPSGNLLEFWVYLISAALVPPAGGVWALVERSRFSTIVLGVAALCVAIMVYRMWQIWTIQLA